MRRPRVITGLPVHQHHVWDNSSRPIRRCRASSPDPRDEAGYHDGGPARPPARRLRPLRRPQVKLAAWLRRRRGAPDPQALAHAERPLRLPARHPPRRADRPSTGAGERYVQDYTWDSPAPDLPPTSLATADHLDRFCGRTAADFVAAWAGGERLYLQVCFPGPHKPFDPTSEVLARIDPDDPRMPPAILQAPAPPLAPLVQQVLLEKGEDFDEQSVRRLQQHYFAKVSLVDDGVGDVFAALKAAGLYDRAWIIVHSDHGELLGDHQLTGKRLGYEGAIRVPLMIRPPGGTTPWTDDGQVDQLDVTATILALCGLDPTGYGDRDLSARVLGGPQGPQAHQTKPVMYENLGMVGIRDERYKLGWDLATGRPVELYDLVADPQERANRVLDPALRGALDDLVATLRTLRPLPVDDWNG
ncbi:MAG: sulfatase-like hydrolase/transferase [Myxococcota bacterium]